MTGEGGQPRREMKTPAIDLSEMAAKESRTGETYTLRCRNSKRMVARYCWSVHLLKRGGDIKEVESATNVGTAVADKLASIFRSEDRQVSTKASGMVSITMKFTNAGHETGHHVVDTALVRIEDRMNACYVSLLRSC